MSIGLRNSLCKHRMEFMRRTAARPDRDSEKATEIEQHNRRSNKAVPQSGEQTSGARMNAQDRTSRHYGTLKHVTKKVFADDRSKEWR
jgi:hypothetical protein